MTNTPTEEELFEWLQLEPRSLELINQLRPLLASFLHQGHTRRLVIHDLLLAACALSAGQSPLPDRPDLGPEAPTDEQAGRYLHDFLNAIIRYQQDLISLTQPTNSDTTH